MRQTHVPAHAACNRPPRIKLLQRLASQLGGMPTARAPGVADVADVAWLDTVIDRLAGSEQHVLEMRYLAGLEFVEIGFTLGTDAGRANAIHDGALDTLRRLRRQLTPARSR